MLDPFATMLDVIYTNPHQGRDGWYTDSAGQGKPVRVLESQEDELTPFLSTGIQQRAVRYKIRRSELPARPVAGEMLEVGGESFHIKKAQPDRRGISWMLDVEPQ